MSTLSEPAGVRIGEAARRTGVSTDLLRAWEQRYGIPEPSRTAGGLRLYPAAELERVTAMRALVDGGLAPAEAARSVKTGAAAAAGPRPGELDGLAESLAARLLAFDDSGSQALVDRLLASFSTELVVREVILPLLRELGDGWSAGTVTVAQEHFASTLLRGRLLALGRGWDRGTGPRAVLACAPEELHDIGLIAFAIELRAQGLRITYLGQDTPAATLAETVDSVRPDVLVVAGRKTAGLRAALGALDEGCGALLFAAGSGAERLAARGVVALGGEPGHAAGQVVEALAAAR